MRTTLRMHPALSGLLGARQHDAQPGQLKPASAQQPLPTHAGVGAAVVGAAVVGGSVGDAVVGARVGDAVVGARVPPRATAVPKKA